MSLRRIAALFFSLCAFAMSAPALAAPSYAEDMSMGSLKAKVTVIEYASASCPHCAWFNNAVFPLFKAKYVDTGKVRYVFREFLTPPVEFAETAVLIARCQGDKAYFPILDAVFHDQEAIYQSGDLAGGLLKIAERFGLTKDQVAACGADQKAIDALSARLDKAQKAGIDATPTFIINGKMVQGEQSLGDLDALIGPLLK